MEELRYRRAVFGWTMYDWANSAFGTTIMAAVLPVYYSRVAAVNLPPNLATAYWGYTNAVALFVIALLSPILGALADFVGAKKRFLTFFVFLGILGSALLALVQSGDWLIASLFFMLGILVSLVRWCSMTHCFPMLQEQMKSIRFLHAGTRWVILGVVLY